MYQIYTILLAIWVIAMIPIFSLRARHYKKYLPDLPQRFGRLPHSLRSDGRPTIWFHSCSVGETLSVQCLADDFHRRFPEARFVLSTITRTGQAIARERFAQYDQGNTFYFPFDLPIVARRVLDWIQPAVIVIIDTEIWPNVLHQAYRRRIPIIMANGRISQQSFRFYRWARPFLSTVFKNYSVFMMKSPEDAHRIIKLGAPSGKVFVSGNIKYDKELVEEKFSGLLAHSLDAELGLTSGKGALIVAGSTHPGEEQVLLEVLRRVRQAPGLAQTRLLLAPRNPERFNEVVKLAGQEGFDVQRRSETTRPPSGAAVLVLDTLGELATAYHFATIAFVGGTLIPHGGQSIMEPGWHAKPIVTGPSMENFRQILNDFKARGAIRQIQATSENRAAQISELTEVFVALLNDGHLRKTMGDAAYSVFENSKGATRFSVDRIAALFEDALAPRR